MLPFEDVFGSWLICLLYYKSAFFPNSKIQGGFKLIGDLLEELDDKVCLLLSALDNYY